MIHEQRHCFFDLVFDTRFSFLVDDFGLANEYQGGRILARRVS